MQSREKLVGHMKLGVRPGLLFALVLAVLATVSCLPPPGNQTHISLSQAIALSRSHNIQKVLVEPDKGTMTMTAAPIKVTDVDGNEVDIPNGSQLVTNIGTMDISDLQALGFELPAEYATTPVSSGSDLGSTLLVLLPLIFLFILIFSLSRAGRAMQDQAANFSRSRARLVSANTPRVTFADVAGVEEAKDDLMEVVDFLKSRQKFQAMGAKIPKGVLLVGPPGTGKTLMARAVAGEAGVPFFAVSGSEFVEMFVGVGAARVRDLFTRAKHNTPCIIFIDEIDAVGRFRAGSIPGSHEEREQTLNQILVEMDGFEPNMGVIVLAATNRADVLDTALLRPGRFDRRVILELPDTNGRKAILQIHAKGKSLDPSVDLSVVAKETHGFSGADLANLVNEAAIIAVRRKKPTIGMEELGEAVDRVLAGPERKSLKIDPRDKSLTAYHEAGHALVAHTLPNVDPVRKISIVARGSMGGYTRLLTEDRYFMTASQFRDTLATLVAGHAAEEMIFNEISTGPHSDIKQATALARRMVTDFGMSKRMGLRTYGNQAVSGYLGFGPPDQKDYSEEVARKIDEEIYNIMDVAQHVAQKVLSENRARLTHLAEKLLVKEVLEGAELEAAFSESLTPDEAKIPQKVAS